MARRTGRDVFLRISAALLATLPLTLYASLALTAFLPASEQARAAIGFFAPLPLYSLFACLAARMQSGVRAWATCLIASGILKLVLVAAL